MYRSSIRLLAFVALAIFVMSALPAHAQLFPIQSSDFHVTTSDGVSIHVHRKVIGSTPGGFAGASVLLIHGTFGDARTWDFPGRNVMDRLAAEGYDVYALDLRGMGNSDKPANYFTIDILNRVTDAATVAGYILGSTGKAPVVLGWSQGGVITGLLAANAPQLVTGVGFFSVAEDGFTVPPALLPVLEQLIVNPPQDGRFLATEAEINALVFGPLMSSQAEDAFFSISDPDAVPAIGELVTKAFFDAALAPAWPKIKVPVLIVDGALDPLVGTQSSQALFNALTGTANKHLVIFPFNSHAWFLENNHNLTMLPVDLFLLQFRSFHLPDSD